MSPVPPPTPFSAHTPWPLPHELRFTGQRAVPCNSRCNSSSSMRRSHRCRYDDMRHSSALRLCLCICISWACREARQRSGYRKACASFALALDVTPASDRRLRASASSRRPSGAHVTLRVFILHFACTLLQRSLAGRGHWNSPGRRRNSVLRHHLFGGCLVLLDARHSCCSCAICRCTWYEAALSF